MGHQPLLAAQWVASTRDKQALKAADPMLTQFWPILVSNLEREFACSTHTRNCMDRKDQDVRIMKNTQCLVGRDFSKLMECPLCWERMIVMDEWKGKIRTTIWSLARTMTQWHLLIAVLFVTKWLEGLGNWGERYSRSDYTFTFLTSHWDRGNGVVSLFKWRLLEAASGREGGLNRRVALLLLPARIQPTLLPSPSPLSYSASRRTPIQGGGKNAT